jgi:rhodanese-related sulfurtransferase
MDQIIKFATNHWQLCVAFVVIVLLIILNEFLAQKKQGKSVSPQEAIELINHKKAVIFDLRPIEAYNKGHILNSIRTTDNDLKSMEKYKNKTIILVCTKGIQSSALSAQLIKNGFAQTFILAGGITAWQNDNLPLIKGK